MSGGMGSAPFVQTAGLRGMLAARAGIAGFGPAVYGFGLDLLDPQPRTVLLVSQIDATLIIHVDSIPGQHHPGVVNERLTPGLDE